MPHLIHNARFVIAGIENAEEAAERLRDEVGTVAGAEAPCHFARRDIAAGEEEGDVGLSHSRRTGER